MEFIQIIEMRTDRIEDVAALVREWEQATEGRRTARRSVLTRDRNDPSRYLVIVSFDTYEEAMANSDLPETAELGRKQAALLDTPMQFTDLDVVETFL